MYRSTVQAVRMASLAAITFFASSVCLADSHDEYGPRKGDREITVTGSGSSDTNFNSSGFGVSGSYGYFFSDRLEGLFRQSVSFADTDDSSSVFIGSTGVALDYHIPIGKRWYPYVGLALGLVWGDVKETGFGGPEVGLKYFALEKTFVFFQAQYQFFFENASSIDNNFDDGQLLYSVGMGFEF